MDEARSEVTSDSEQDQSILEVHTQMKLLEEEQEYNINHVRESFLQEITQLNDIIQVLKVEKDEQKATHKKTLTEMVEKHTANLKDQKHNHKDRLSEAYEKQKELEQKLQAMQQNYKKRLRKKEDSCIHPSLDMIQARDDRLQDLEAKVEEIINKNKDISEDLKQQLKIQEQQLCTEQAKIRNLENFLERMNADLQSCSKQIQHPRLLKENFLKLQLHKPVTLDANAAGVQETVDCQGIEARYLQATWSNSLKAEVEEGNQRNIEDLKQMLQIKEQELCAEKKKVRNMETLAQRMKDDLYTCSKYVQYPHLLKEHFVKLQLHKTVRLITKNQQAGRSSNPKLEAEVEEMNSRNHENMEILCQKLKIQKQQLCTEQAKVRNLETFMRRMNTDLRTCSQYIQYPQLLKENFIKLQLHNPARIDVKSMDVQNSRKKEQLQRMMDSQEQRPSTEARFHLELEAEEVNSKSMETIEYLKQKLQIQNLELCTERKKVKNMENLLQKIKADLQTCTNFLHYPHLLSENFINLQLHKPLKSAVQEATSKKQETIEELRRKLKIQERELCTERKRVNNLNTLVNRMKDDIQTCSSFVQYPQQLKENFIKLQLHKPARFNVKTGVVQEHPWSKEQLQSTMGSQGQYQAMKTKNQQADCFNSVKQQVKVLLEVKTTEEAKKLIKEHDEAEHYGKKKETIYDLTNMLRMKEKELIVERQRVRNMNTLMERMKADIQTCASFIQEPILLKETFKKLHKNYVQEADTRVGVKAVDHSRKKQLQSTQESHEEIQAMDAKNEQAGGSINLKQQAKMLQEVKAPEGTKVSRKIMYDLNQRLKMKGKDLSIEKQRVRQIKGLLERMKADIQTCLSFILEPRMLREKFINLYKSYILDADVKVKALHRKVNFLNNSQLESLSLEKTNIQEYRKNTLLAKNSVSDIGRYSWKLQVPQANMQTMRKRNVWDMER